MSTVESMDDYFLSCEENSEGINTKESVKMMNAMVELIKEKGMGIALDLDRDLKSRTGKSIVRRALLKVHPGLDQMFAEKKAAASNQEIERWLHKAKEAIEATTAKKYPEIPSLHKTLKWSVGGKYYRVLTEAKQGGSGSAYCFIGSTLSNQRERNGYQHRCTLVLRSQRKTNL